MDLSSHALIIIDLQQRVVALSAAPHPTEEVLGRVEVRTLFRGMSGSGQSTAISDSYI